MTFEALMNNYIEEQIRRGAVLLLAMQNYRVYENIDLSWRNFRIRSKGLTYSNVVSFRKSIN